MADWLTWQAMYPISLLVVADSVLQDLLEVSMEGCTGHVHPSLHIALDLGQMHHLARRHPVTVVLDVCFHLPLHHATTMSE